MTHMEFVAERRKIILRLCDGRHTRADIARRTGLSQYTINNDISALRSKGQDVRLLDSRTHEGRRRA